MKAILNVVLAISMSASFAGHAQSINAERAAEAANVAASTAKNVLIQASYAGYYVELITLELLQLHLQRQLLIQKTVGATQDSVQNLTVQIPAALLEGYLGLKILDKGRRTAVIPAEVAKELPAIEARLSKLIEQTAAINVNQLAKNQLPEYLAATQAELNAILESVKDTPKAAAAPKAPGIIAKMARRTLVIAGITVFVDAIGTAPSLVIATFSDAGRPHYGRGCSGYYRSSDCKEESFLEWAVAGLDSKNSEIKSMLSAAWKN